MAKNKKRKVKKQDHRSILIPPAALDKLEKLPTPHNTNCIVLYLFYLKKCARDKTNRIWCDNSYVAGIIGDDGKRKGLKWDKGRVEKTKAQLVKLKFITVVQSHDNLTGHFSKKYIEVRFFASKMTIENEQYLSILDEYVEEFVEWLNYFTSQKMKDEIKIAGLEKQITDARFLPVTGKTGIRAYRNGRGKAYKTRIVATKDGDRVNGVLLCKDNIKKTFDEICAIKLEKSIRDNRKIYRKIKRHIWKDHFRELRVGSKIKKGRIKKVLLWYIKHFGDEYVPRAYSAKTFCDKFLNIEDAMERSIADAKKGKGIKYTKIKVK